ncbi:MAG: LamG domain-containing protein, partial [Planctomycetes bacterium]|nr:LamG domain-containing protein [Planctomycetota bacterium]
YMRGLPFNMDGAPLPLEKFPSGANADAGAPPATQRADRAHLFSPTGFVDDSWWHRTYWMYGSRFVSGWCGYYLSGKAAPAGRILCFDDNKVYGFGRKPQYYRWTTPIEHHLFAANKMADTAESSSGGGGGKSFIEVAKSKSLNPAGKAITVEAWIKPDKNSGVIVAKGGASLGYVLYLQNARPRFGVRAESVFSSANAGTKIGNEWTHVAGVLTEDKKLHIYVNGKLAASAKAAGLLGGDPAEVMQIGADEGSTVGEYNGGYGFNGLIDEVRVYHRALSANEIARDASAQSNLTADKAGLVLCYTFDGKRLLDASGNENVGKIEGVKSAKGKFGRAMRFTGTAATIRGFMVRYDWTKDLPIFARAMVLAEKTLFVAGPPDLVDEPQAFAHIDQAQVKQSLAEQAAAMEGKKGAVLMAVSTADPDESTQYQLDSPPVFDGMAVAGGRLYISTVNGKVLCMTPNKQTAQK